MKHAILILAHNNLDYLSTSIDYFDNDFDIYIHLDKKAVFQDEELKLLEEKANVVCLLHNKYKTNWGGHNILKAELSLLEKATEKQDYDYFHLISGQDIATKSLSEFKQFFKQANGSDFLEYKEFTKEESKGEIFSRFDYLYAFDLFDYKTLSGYKKITRLLDFQQKHSIKRKAPLQFEVIYKGSAWFSLTHASAKYIVEYTKLHPSFYKKLKYSFAPEEIYIPTILVNSSLVENIINNNLRYIVWEYRNGNSPAVLDESDYIRILQSDAFFARKISFPTSSSLVDKIKFRQEHSLMNEQENDIFNISAQGYWENKSFKGHYYDAELGEAFCLFFELMEVKTIVDFGCGPGWYVKALRDVGFSISGYDGNPFTETLSNMILQDGTTCGQIELSEKIELSDKPDLILSLKVGEHIPKEFEDIYINNLIRNSNKYIVMSWAVENQGGDGQVNCCNNDYIIEKFTQLGLTEVITAKNYFRGVAELPWFKNTIFVFQKE